MMLISFVGVSSVIVVWSWCCFVVIIFGSSFYYLFWVSKKAYSVVVHFEFVAFEYVLFALFYCCCFNEFF